MGGCEDGEVIRAARSLIEQVRVTVPGYAAGFCGVGTKDVSAMLVQSRTYLRERPFGESEAKAMVMPFGAGGWDHLLVVDSACTRADWNFTVRHELAHIIRGEAAEVMFLTSEDTMSHAERVADLFAVADLVPAGWLAWVRRGRRPWSHVLLDVVQAYRELTEDWTELRLWDRARLRLALYRAHGI